MLRQFEKEKERANGESSSTPNSPEKMKDGNFHEIFSKLMSERNKIRLEMRQLEEEQEKAMEKNKYKVRVEQASLCSKEVTELQILIDKCGNRYGHFKNEMQYLQEDINSILKAMSVSVGSDKKQDDSDLETHKKPGDKKI